MAYKSLQEKSRFLKTLGIGTNKTIRTDEITECEEYADSIIEGKLGKSWATGSVPKLIEKVADLLGSGYAYFFILTGQTPKQSEYAENLDKKGMEILQQIADGKIGLKLPDGTWDDDYPGSSNVEDNRPGSIEILG